jgi:threonine/homoserine/homoserine lactone efflux protein
VEHFFAGYLFGLAFQLGIGPVSLAVIHNALNAGWLSSWVMVCGVALTDGFYIALSIMGIAAIMQIPGLQLWFGFGGALVLIYFGIRAWRRPVGSSDPLTLRRGMVQNFLYGIGITLTNPLTILFWSGTFGQWVLDGKFAARIDLLVFGSGCVAATLTALTFLALFAGQAKRYLSPTVLRWVNRASGLFLIGFAVRMMIIALRN